MVTYVHVHRLKTWLKVDLLWLMEVFYVIGQIKMQPRKFSRLPEWGNTSVPPHLIQEKLLFCSLYCKLTAYHAINTLVWKLNQQLFHYFSIQFKLEVTVLTHFLWTYRYGLYFIPNGSNKKVWLKGNGLHLMKIVNLLKALIMYIKMDNKVCAGTQLRPFQPLLKIDPIQTKAIFTGDPRAHLATSSLN